MISYARAKEIMDTVFSECQSLREAGQKEYSQSKDGLKNET